MFSIFRPFFALTIVLAAVTANAGGISAGGGGTVPPQQVSAQEIFDAIGSRNMTAAIHSWLYAQEIWWLTGKLDGKGLPYVKVFGMVRDYEKRRGVVFNILKQLEVDVRLKGACLDSAGGEQDGSIFTDLKSKTAICISADRLSKKLSRDNYQMQTAALIIHEVSHLLGTTEDEAVRMQMAAIEGLRTISFPNALDLALGVSKGVRATQLLVEKLQRRLSQFSDLHDRDLAEMARDIQSSIVYAFDYQIKDFDRFPDSGVFLSPIGFKPLDTGWSLHAQANNIEFATCDKTIWTGDCAKAYTEVFNGADFLFARSYYVNTSHVDVRQELFWQVRGQWVDAKVPNIRSMVALKLAVEDMIKTLKYLNNFDLYYPPEFKTRIR